MYKILLLHNADHNLWKLHGTYTTTTSTSGSSTTFKEFETDDLDILKAEILKLDKKYGHENFKIYKDITANYSVDIFADKLIEYNE